MFFFHLSRRNASDRIEAGHLGDDVKACQPPKTSWAPRLGITSNVSSNNHLRVHPCRFGPGRAWHFYRTGSHVVLLTGSTDSKCVYAPATIGQLVRKPGIGMLVNARHSATSSGPWSGCHPKRNPPKAASIRTRPSPVQGRKASSVAHSESFG